MLCIHTPVNDVEEQVSQGEYDSGVGVNHVAVAHYKAEIVFKRVLAAKPGAFCVCRDGRVARLGVSLCVRGAGDFSERSQVDVVVMEAAIKDHSLVGVIGGGDLQQQRETRREESDGPRWWEVIFCGSHH